MPLPEAVEAAAFGGGEGVLGAMQCCQSPA